jgi:hypothetical protein
MLQLPGKDMIVEYLKTFRQISAVASKCRLPSDAGTCTPNASPETHEALVLFCASFQIQCVPPSLSLWQCHPERG